MMRQRTHDATSYKALLPAVSLPHGQVSLCCCMASMYNLWTCMQTERSVYEAASRAVLHQREPDGTKKTHPTCPLPAAALPSAGSTIMFLSDCPVQAACGYVPHNRQHNEWSALCSAILALMSRLLDAKHFLDCLM